MVVKKNNNNLIALNKGKIPPQAIDLEIGILGAMLIDKRGVDETVNIIKSPNVFYKEAHKYIYAAMLDIIEDNDPIDILTVGHRLRKIGKLDAVGGDFYLVTLSQSVASSAHIEMHCRLVLQFWVKREFIKYANQNIEKCYDETEDIFDLIEQHEKQLDFVNETILSGQKLMSWSQALQKVVKRVELLSSVDSAEITGMTTGIEKLDTFTGGWQPGSLVVIAARPGMGKTAFILLNLSKIALAGHPVGMFSLEMSIVQLATRIVAINSHFHLAQLFRDGFRSSDPKKVDDYFTKLITVKGKLDALPILIDDNASLTISELYMKARTWKRQYNIQALFVDYIQLMGGDSVGNRELDISTISRKLKQLAKELDIPVIALSQLSRAVESRSNKRPKLSDLRESGGIEQDADVVAFIYRPEYYDLHPSDEMAEAGANTEFIFGKFRQGSLSTRWLHWDGNKTKFSDPVDKLIDVEPF